MSPPEPPPRGASSGARGHHALVEKMNLDAVFTLEQQLRVDALAVLREGPQAFARPRRACGSDYMRVPAVIISHRPILTWVTRSTKVAPPPPAGRQEQAEGETERDEDGKGRLGLLRGRRRRGVGTSSMAPLADWPDCAAKLTLAVIRKTRSPSILIFNGNGPPRFGRGSQECVRPPAVRPASSQCHSSGQLGTAIHPVARTDL